MKNIPIGFYERLSSGTLPAKLLDNLDVFANHSLTEVLQGAMSCAL
jgi:hypothetical protein